MSDDTSPQTEPVSSVEATDPAAPAARRMRWGYVVGGVLVVAALALGAWALWGGQAALAPSASASSSPAASVSASASASSAPEASSEPANSTAPPAAGDEPVAPPEEAPVPPTISDFGSTQAVASCADDRSATASISLSWTVEGADEVFIAVDASDASAQPFDTVGATAEAYTAIEFECVRAEQIITLTARNGDGAVSRSITITRELV